MNNMMKQVRGYIKRHGKDIRICKLVNDDGQCYDGIICIDYRSHITSTLIHEILHILTPQLTEEQVRELEIELLAKATPQDVRAILISVLDSIMENGIVAEDDVE